jgi:hypothetical protein
MCGRDLNESDLDYTVKIEVISGDVRRDLGEDFDGDFDKAVDDLIQKAEQKSEAELMDEVYRKMIFKICPACQKEYLKNPIQRKF